MDEEMVKNFQQYKRAVYAVAANQQEEADSLADEFTATRGFASKMAERWNAFAEEISPGTATSVDRNLIAALNDGLLDALKNLESRIVQLEQR